MSLLTARVDLGEHALGVSLWLDIAVRPLAFSNAGGIIEAVSVLDGNKFVDNEKRSWFGAGMHPPKFDYVAARSVQEAVGMLGEYGDDARLLAGGQSLIPLLKLRLTSPKVLIDIGRIPGLAAVEAVEAVDGWLTFGALVRHGEVAASDLVRRSMLILSEAGAGIGDPQVRNWGTMGGALALADPSGDWAAVSLAVNAEMTAESPRGTRAIAARNFFLDTYTTALRPDEMLTQVRVPTPAADTRSGGAFVKFNRRTGDLSTASVAVQLTLGADGTCRGIGVGLGGATTQVLKAEGAEAVLMGTRLEEEAVLEACARIDEVSDPVLRSPAGYHKALLKTLFRRALSAASNRAEGREPCR